MPLTNDMQRSGAVVELATLATHSQSSSPVAQTRSRASKKVAANSPPAAARAPATKSDAVVKLLRSTKGASIDEIMNATGWQAHSVRGFLSGTVKKKLRLELSSETGKDGARRYRVVSAPKSS